MSARRLFTLAGALVLALLGAGLLLPAEREVRRARAIDAPRGVLHRLLLEPARREVWAPDWISGAELTAALPERGVWWNLDVTRLGVRAKSAKSAVLYAPGVEGGTPTGSRLTWIVRLRTGRDPLRRWLALFAARRLGADMDIALTRVAAALEAR